jgi:hypothetical protein
MTGPTNVDVTLDFQSLQPTVTISLTSVVIPAGQTSATFTITGVTAGPTRVMAILAGAEAAAQIQVVP